MLCDKIGASPRPKRQLEKYYTWEICAMRFLDVLEEYLRRYAAEDTKQVDCSQLYGLIQSPPPLAEHIVFHPLDDVLKTDLVGRYKRVFPLDLLELYSHINGANLFWIRVPLRNGAIQIPCCLFAIHGVPLTYDRTHLEPFNLSIEDLNRPQETPESWLKFGSYYHPNNFSDRHDLFVDTDTLSVFSIKHGQEICRVETEWTSIDACLFDIFNLLSSCYESIKAD
jgi:hypothetical protein